MRRVSPVPIIKDVKVTDLMVTDVVTTRPDVPIEVARRDMLARKHKILPVVDEEGRLIGITDRFDLLQAIARLEDQHA
jgi:CBS-domain-containing membrane protein